MSASSLCVACMTGATSCTDAVTLAGCNPIGYWPNATPPTKCT